MKTQTRNILIGISIFAVIFLIAGFQLNLFSIFNTELGWIPLTESTSGISNLVFSNTGFTSKYWNGVGSGNYVSGDDNNIMITAPSGDIYNFVTLNTDLKGKTIKIDYETYGGPGTQGFNYGSPATVMGIALPLPAQGNIEIRSSVLNSTISKLYVNGQYKKDIDTTKEKLTFGVIRSGSCPSCTQQASSSMRLYNPRYKPAFDCKIDNDEVLIFDEFASSTSFNIQDLTYQVKKFCINQPVIIRSFTERGIATDSDGEILIKLSEGGTVNVASDQTIRVPYVTKTQTGLLRCPASQAFNTKTKQCESILGEGLPDVVGSFITGLDIGENEVKFTQTSASQQSISIGDVIFNPSEQKYDLSCGCDIQGRIAPPSPQAKCWYVTKGMDKITSESTYKLNDYLSIYYQASGIGVYNGLRGTSGIIYSCQFVKDTDWVNLYKIKINKEGLKITQGSTNANISLNTIGNFKATLDNRLGNFQSSGFRVRTIENIIDRVTDQDVSMPLSKGIKEYSLPISQKTLGNVDIEVIPYIDIEGKRIYGSSKIIFKYSVIVGETSLEELRVLNQTLNEKIALLQQYRNNIDELAKKIVEYDLTTQEQDKIIMDLNLSLESQESLKGKISEIESLKTKNKILYISLGIISAILIFVLIFLIIIKLRKS